VNSTHRDRLRDRPFEAGATCRIKPATVPTPAGCPMALTGRWDVVDPRVSVDDSAATL
jgi:hypothetical protein